MTRWDKKQSDEQISWELSKNIQKRDETDESYVRIKVNEVRKRGQKKKKTLKETEYSQLEHADLIWKEKLKELTDDDWQQLAIVGPCACSG